MFSKLLRTTTTCSVLITLLLQSTTSYFILLLRMQIAVELCHILCKCVFAVQHNNFFLHFLVPHLQVVRHTRMYSMYSLHDNPCQTVAPVKTRRCFVGAKFYSINRNRTRNETSPKWPILCQVGHKTLLSSVATAREIGWEEHLQNDTWGDSDVILIPAGFCRHLVGKT